MKRLMMILLALALLLPALPACAEPAQAPTLETLSELEWMFCSGVGAWSTLMWIEPDGTFIGDFHDSDMGDIGEGYPDCMIYFCR